jgi:hypothetical protein
MSRQSWDWTVIKCGKPLSQYVFGSKSIQTQFRFLGGLQGPCRSKLQEVNLRETLVLLPICSASSALELRMKHLRHAFWNIYRSVAARDLSRAGTDPIARERLAAGVMCNLPTLVPLLIAHSNPRRNLITPPPRIGHYASRNQAMPKSNRGMEPLFVAAELQPERFINKRISPIKRGCGRLESLQCKYHTLLNISVKPVKRETQIAEMATI